MLFKEKLLLSNCDSVRQLGQSELRKRFLMGVTFGDGVVISPNTLIDNLYFDKILSRRNLVKYLNEEGSGKLVIRGFNIEEDFNLFDYYENLPDNFIFSSFINSPSKKDLNQYQVKLLLERLDHTQTALQNIQYKSEGAKLDQKALQKEIFSRIDNNLLLESYFYDISEKDEFKMRTSGVYSRSDWYQASDIYFKENARVNSLIFKKEVINPAYNSLFAAKGEGFLLDEIKFLNDVPERILDIGVVYKSLKKEIELIQYPYKAFEIITTLGSTELIQLITDEAMGYIEDKLQDKTERALTRKNWFGMYNKMQNYIGLELK